MKKSNLLLILAIAILAPILVSSCDNCKYKYADFSGKYEFNNKDTIKSLGLNADGVEVVAAKIVLIDDANIKKSFGSAKIVLTCVVELTDSIFKNEWYLTYDIKDLSDSLQIVELVNNKKWVCDVELWCDWLKEDCNTHIISPFSSLNVDFNNVNNIKYIDDKGELKELEYLEASEQVKESIERGLCHKLDEEYGCESESDPEEYWHNRKLMRWHILGVQDDGFTIKGKGNKTVKFKRLEKSSLQDLYK